MIQWIKTQTLNFFGRNKNPYYKKLKKVLDSQKSISLYNKIYYLGGFEHSNVTYINFKECVKTGGLKQFFETVKYDTQENNVELYLIESDGEYYLLTLFDPLELFAQEQILDIIKFPKTGLEGLKYELIYSDVETT